MLRERCRDPNVLYDAKEYTQHTYWDSEKMDKPLLVCIHKVMHQEPVFFDTVVKIKAQWQPCLSLNLVAKPPTAQGASEDRGKGKVEIGKAETRAQADKSDSHTVKKILDHGPTRTGLPHSI